MIDVHSHIIFGVDDGSSFMEESVRMLEEANKAGIKIIVATPHFQPDIFNSEKMLEHFQQLCTRAAEFEITVLPGYEVFMQPFVPDLIKSNKKLTMNSSQYLLLEFPFDSIPFYSHEVIYKLQLQGIIPIIAHPERNRCFVKDFGAFMEFVESGCLVQVDAASMLGTYGRRTKRFVKRLIKNNLVNFIASDAHCAKDYRNWYLKAYDKAKRWGGEKYTDKMFYLNASVILDKAKNDMNHLV